MRYLSDVYRIITMGKIMFFGKISKVFKGRLIIFQICREGGTKYLFITVGRSAALVITDGRSAPPGC